MRRLRYEPAAIRDLRGVYLYARGEFGRTVADDYVRGLREDIRRLTVLPHRGRPWDEDTRRMRHERHIVFYRVVDDEVAIDRVLHERQLPPGAL